MLPLETLGVNNRFLTCFLEQTLAELQIEQLPAPFPSASLSMSCFNTATWNPFALTMSSLRKYGLGWANFLVMRRTHATLKKALGMDGKLVADQLGHSLDVNQNVYTQSPVESRLDMVNQLEKSLRVM